MCVESFEICGGDYALKNKRITKRLVVASHAN